MNIREAIVGRGGAGVPGGHIGQHRPAGVIGLSQFGLRHKITLQSAKIKTKYDK